MIGDVTARTGSAAVETLRNHPEQLLSPIVVVWLMIFCWNILGDALNDILNPRAR
jgi:ABC-type dipeptide/oligopeptide/nickel transport system permease subunit